ncbi:MAG: hypothetical protein A2017_18405 [Lentisphaerae bacterium GWF2_44_16]|nr:MAG: hypothetical protein A2017_18405 [Lentisphaerae bacterium GWF2_44_16]
MVLFNLVAGKLAHIKEKPFVLEKNIQELVENNLANLLNLELVCSEFAIKNFRFDTVAFDRKSMAFVVIEYKRNQNFSVIDQGYAYLSVMLNNKSDFILEYNENCKDKLKKDSLDWSQSRVVFIAPSFSAYQKEAVNFKDLPISLWEIRRYANSTISFNEIRKMGAPESIKTISKGNDKVSQVSREIVVYTEDDHVKSCNREITELYQSLKEAILTFDDVEMIPRKLYIAFTVKGTNFVDIHFLKKGLKLWINLHKGELKDIENKARDVSNTGHWGNGDYEIQITTPAQLDYLMTLIKQSYIRHRE